jgi:hypothetical protein
VIVLYIVLFLVGCVALGKFINGRSDRAVSMTNELDGGTRRRLKPMTTIVDTEENPRNLDDGTSFGYEEFD